MALSRSLLLDGEKVIVTVRTHIKYLFGKIGVALLIAVAGGAIAMLVGGDVGMWVGIGTLAVVLVVVVPPWLIWLSWTYNLTNRRLIEQKGVFKRTGRIIPLSRINHVSFEKDFTDRLLKCGTLIVHDASEQTGLKLDDIPKIESFHRTISTLVLEAHGQGLDPKKPERDADL